MIGTILSDRAAVSSEGIKADTGDVSRLNYGRARCQPACRAAKMTALMVAHQREVQALPEDSPRRKPTLPTLRFVSPTRAFDLRPAGLKDVNDPLRIRS